MEIIKPEQGTKLPLEFTAVKRLASAYMEVVELELKELESIELHSLTCKVLFYVKEGEAFFLSENRNTPVNKGSIIIVNPNELRGWMCKKGQGVKLLVVKMFE